MQVVLIIFSIGLLGLILYFAFSPRSSRLLRLTAIIALALIGAALGVCIVIIILGPAEDPSAISFPVFPDSPQKKEKISNLTEIIAFVVVLLIVAGTLIASGLRNKKKMAKEAVKKKSAAQIFVEDDVSNVFTSDSEESFDIDFD